MRRTRLALVALALVAAVAATGCGRIFEENNVTIGSAPYTEGSGKVVTVTRALREFTGVDVENGVTVFVRHGSKSSVDVTADDNLTGLIATDVSGSTLTIRVTGSLTSHHQVKVDVTSAREIASITADSGSSVESEDLTAADLQVDVNAGSTLHAGGKTTALHLSVNAGSTADLKNVEAATAEVQVNAGSTAVLNVSGSVSGGCVAGSTLKVSGGADTSGVAKDIASTVDG